MFKAQFNNADIKKFIEAKQKKLYEVIITKLEYRGEDFIGKARSTRTYKDRTANLRNSIGYAVVHNKKVVKINFPNDAAPGMDLKMRRGEILTSAKAKARREARKGGAKEGMEFIRDIIKSKIEDNGFYLICVAGKNYAIYVESKGFDVITGTAKAMNGKVEADIKRIFEKI